MVGLEAVAPVPAFPEEERLGRDERFVGKGGFEVLAVPAKRGRPRKVQNQKQLTEVLRLYFVEKMSMRQVADIIGVSHMSVYRMLSDPSIELLI